MSEAAGSQRTATIHRFRRDLAAEAKPVLLAGTLKQLSITSPTRHRMLMLMQTWLYAAERDGVTLRQPGYADALNRAISALECSQTLAQAIALLRAQETALAGETRA